MTLYIVLTSYVSADWNWSTVTIDILGELLVEDEGGTTRYRLDV